MKKIISVFVVLGIFAAVLAFASPVFAYSNSDDETPGYVSQYEYNTAPLNQTMSVYEHEWGVVGLGTVVVYQNGGKHIIKAYPYGSKWYCTGSNVQVSYDLNAQGQYIGKYATAYIYEVDPLGRVCQ